MAADIGDFIRRPIAIDRRVNDCVVDERYALLTEFVPTLGVVLIRLVELGIGAERGEESSLVIRRAPHPSVGNPRPLGDRLATGDEVLHALWRLEEGVRHATIAGVGR